ncbi:hypothetical protein [Sphingomonas sp. CCH5-D11]|uniref:hypothetical protein n=1 Tax=Sphingomonas sp. CCH5-D11 TaxID=1768786 RepID=UPI00082EFC2D|nr:hypothetical protein [Sphingomonas sp. CCH5-D11]
MMLETVTSPAGPDPRAEWDAAFAVWRREQERDAAINARHAQAQADGTLSKDLADEWSASVEPLGEAEWALFATPAPDLAALEWKLALLKNNGMAFDDSQAERLIADVRRLNGEG